MRARRGSSFGLQICPAASLLILEKPLLQFGCFNFLEGFVQEEVALSIISCCCRATADRGAGGVSRGVALLGWVYLFIPICSLPPK